MHPTATLVTTWTPASGELDDPSSYKCMQLQVFGVKYNRGLHNHAQKRKFSQF